MTNFNLNQNSNQSRVEEFNKIQKRLREFYSEPTIKLIEHLRKTHKYSLESIGQIIGMSKQAISQNYIPSEQDANNIKLDHEKQGEIK